MKWSMQCFLSGCGHFDLLEHLDSSSYSCLDAQFYDDETVTVILKDSMGREGRDRILVQLSLSLVYNSEDSDEYEFTGSYSTRCVSLGDWRPHWARGFPVILPRLLLSSLWQPCLSWPWTHGLPALASPLLELPVSITMLANSWLFLCVFFFIYFIAFFVLRQSLAV
jgi:hypothetical protein